MGAFRSRTAERPLNLVNGMGHGTAWLFWVDHLEKGNKCLTINESTRACVCWRGVMKGAMEFTVGETQNAFWQSELCLSSARLCVIIKSFRLGVKFTLLSTWLNVESPRRWACLGFQRALTKKTHPEWWWHHLCLEWWWCHLWLESWIQFFLY